MKKSKRKALGSDPLVMAGLVNDDAKTETGRASKTAHGAGRAKAKKAGATNTGRGPIAADGRACPVAFRIDYDLVQDLRAASFWMQTTISEIVEEALREHLRKLHAKNGGAFARP